MAYDFMYLVNRLCHKFNEVPLTAITFDDAEGVYAEFRDAVNAAIMDIHKRKNNEWPFAWQQLTFRTTPGVNEYSKASNAVNVDWDSFEILKQSIAIDSITRTGTTATATVAAGHTLKDNDRIYIVGANQVEYNGTVYATVTGTTTFTFPVSASAVTPATGTIVVYPPYDNKKLKFLDYDAYRDEGYQSRDNNSYLESSFSAPFYAVRKTDNNIILSPKPDRIYTVQYDSFVLPADLVNATDVPVIPEEHKEVVVEAAMWCVYMFRDNYEEAALADSRYEKSLETMARMLVPQQTFMRIVN